MTEQERLLIEEACKRLMVAYIVYADHNDADAFASVFAEDGIWEQRGREISGRAELAQYIRDKSGKGLARHFMTNMLVDVLDDERATGIAYVSAVRDEDFDGEGMAELQPPALVVEYRDEFVRTADGWRIKRRRSIPIGAFSRK